MSTQTPPPGAEPRCGHHDTELRAPDVNPEGNAHSPTGTFCPVCFPELFTSSPGDADRWEALLDRDWSEVWSTLPEAPDLVPRRTGQRVTPDNGHVIATMPPEELTTPKSSTAWAGAEERECGDHYTSGNRAWCGDCSEWCYPQIPCKGCELPVLRARLAAHDAVTLAAQEVKLTWEAYAGFEHSAPGAQHYQEKTAHAVFLDAVRKLCTVIGNGQAGIASGDPTTMENEFKKASPPDQDTGEWTPTVGETVALPWGLGEIFGKVAEIYGSGLRVQVVIELLPELSSHVVDEPTTVTFPIDAIHRADHAN